MNQLIRFSLVGGVGFVVDTLTFTLLFKGFSADLMLSRTIAFIAAATTTWLGNRYFTFSNPVIEHNFIDVNSIGVNSIADTGINKDSLLTQWRKFMTTACISAIPNLMVFKIIAFYLGTQGLLVYIAMIMGILVGMISNYLLCKYWVFRI